MFLIRDFIYFELFFLININLLSLKQIYIYLLITGNARHKEKFSSYYSAIDVNKQQYARIFIWNLQKDLFESFDTNPPWKSNCYKKFIRTVLKIKKSYPLFLNLQSDHAELSRKPITIQF